MPKVSIIIPTYNRAHKILQPVHSVIQQSSKDWELIIVDDCSTDTTREVLDPIIKKYPVKYLLMPRNCGPSKARNTGMKHAEGRYSAFLDSDDLWEPHFVEKMSTMLDRNHDFGFIYCDSQIYNLARKPYYVFTFEPYSYVELLNSQGKIPTGSFMFRTDCWHQVDGFHEDMGRGEDFEWMLRFGELFDFARCPEILHHYYRDKDGLMHNTGKNRDDIRIWSTILQNTKNQIKRRKYS